MTKTYHNYTVEFNNSEDGIAFWAQHKSSVLAELKEWGYTSDEIKEIDILGTMKLDSYLDDNLIADLNPLD